jgi:PadR family transcriptional regulator PadR
MHEHLYCCLGCNKSQDMSEKGHIVYLSNTNTKGERKMNNIQKEVQTKLTKGLLDLIVLQFLDSQPMHGYQIITKIRRSFGVYFGPSTVYPLLASLEKKGNVESRWSMESERPRKVYELTNRGKNLLDFTENSLNLICKKMANDTTLEVAITGNSSNSIRNQKRTTLARAVRY